MIVTPTVGNTQLARYPLMACRKKGLGSSVVESLDLAWAGAAFISKTLHYKVCPRQSGFTSKVHGVTKSIGSPVQWLAE